MTYSIYIVQCADGTLYTGIAIDVARRLMEHNGEAVGKTGVALKSRGARWTH
jgi:putative endonuclease